MNKSPPVKEKRKIFILDDNQARGYVVEISSCLGKDSALQFEAQIARKNAHTRQPSHQ